MICPGTRVHGTILLLQVKAFRTEFLRIISETALVMFLEDAIWSVSIQGHFSIEEVPEGPQLLATSNSAAVNTFETGTNRAELSHIAARGDLKCPCWTCLQCQNLNGTAHLVAEGIIQEWFEQEQRNIPTPSTHFHSYQR